MRRHTGQMVALALLVGACVGASAEDVFEVAGVVEDPSGNPVAAAEVFALEYDAATQKLLVHSKTETDRSGRFKLAIDPERAKRATLSVAVRHRKWGIAWLRGFRIDPWLSRLFMAQRASVEGIVTDSAGRPVANALVVPAIAVPHFDAYGLLPCEELLSARTGSDGRFVLDGLPEDGTVALMVTHPDYAGLIHGLGKEGNRTVYTLDVGRNDIEVTLEPGGTISGTVTFEGTGKPASGALVEIVPERKDGDRLDVAVLQRVVAAIQAKSDERGKYLLRGLPEGTYCLQATHPGWTALKKEGVKVAGGEVVTGQDFQLIPGVVVSGRVVRADTDEPISGGYVVVYSGSGLVKELRFDVDEDGAFSFRQPPGEVRFYCQAELAGDIRREKSYQQLTLVEGEDVTDLTFRVTPWPVLKGRVVGPDGDGVAGGVVSQLHRMELRAYTAEDGSFELPIMKHAGVDAREDAYVEAHHPEMPHYRGVVGLELDDESELQATIELAPTVTVRGRVVDAEGNPVYRAWVISALWLGRSRPSDKLQILTDLSGHYEFRDVPKGASYSVVATAEGYGKDELDFAKEALIIGDEDVIVRDLVLQVADQVLVAGKEAPDLDVAAWVNGEPTTLAALRGKMVVLAFWDSADEACADLLATLYRLARSFRSSPVEIIAIHGADADQEALTRFVAEKRITYGVALDKPAKLYKRYKGATFEKYRARTVPSLYIIDVEGKVRYQDIPLPALEEALKKLRGEKYGQAHACPERCAIVHSAGLAGNKEYVQTCAGRVDGCSKRRRTAP